MLDNSATYLKGRLEALKGDARLIVKAASAAQRAADFILGCNTQETAVLQTSTRGEKRLSDGSRYAATPNKLSTNFACPIESLPSNLFT